MRARDLKTKAAGFLILFIPAAVMISFITWAVIESTINNATEVLTLDDTRCFVKTDLVKFKTWLDDDSSNGQSVISASGSGSKIFAITVKILGVDCGDAFG